MGQLCIWTKATLGCSGPPSCQTSKKMVREADQGKLRHKHPYSLIKKPLCLHSVSAHQLLCPLSPRGVHTPAHHLGTFQGERTVDPRRKKVQLPPWNSVLPDRTVLWVLGGIAAGPLRSCTGPHSRRAEQFLSLMFFGQGVREAGPAKPVFPEIHLGKINKYIAGSLSPSGGC